MLKFLNVQGVMAEVQASDKKSLLNEMAARASRLTGVHERLILDAVMQREKLGSTGMGKGIAIPHARLKGFPRVVGLFAQLATPIDFDAADSSQVDLVFMILSPEGAGADHLQALGEVSRALRDSATTDRIRHAESEVQILELLTGTQLSTARAA